MSIDGRNSIRSGGTSRTSSSREEPTPRANLRPYQRRSSVIEEENEDNEYQEAQDDGDDRPRPEQPPQSKQDQYLAALRYRFPNRSKSDYSYRPPIGSASSSMPPAPADNTLPKTIRTSTADVGTETPRSGAYQSISRQNTGANNGFDRSDERTFAKPNLRPVNPDQQNAYAKRILKESGTSTPATSEPTVRITEPKTGTARATTGTSPYTTHSTNPLQPHESIFEKISSHGGAVSYLGTGTFSQFEHCLRECLERERQHTGIASHIVRHDIPTTSSFLHDYHHEPTTFIPSSDHIHNPMFQLDDIRSINVALSRSGIPLFPYHQPSHELYSYSTSMSYPPTHNEYPIRQYHSGEVVSACQIAEEDSTVIPKRCETQAVQKVWNALRNYIPSSYYDQSRLITYPMTPYDI